LLDEFFDGFLPLGLLLDFFLVLRLLDFVLKGLRVSVKDLRGDEFGRFVRVLEGGLGVYRLKKRIGVEDLGGVNGLPWYFVAML
jgi:hypothetical protein